MLPNDVVALRERCEILEEENRQLRELLAPRIEWPPEWKLSRSMRTILSALYARQGFVSSEALLQALYGSDEDLRHENIVKIFVSKMRRRLTLALGIDHTIHTVWGSGYCLTPEARAAIAEVLDA